MAGKPVIREVSAGGIVYRRNDDAVEFCIVNTHAGRDWQFPKGHLEKNETREQAAVREVREESGLDAVIEAYLSATSYQFHRPRTIVQKTVHFYLMKYLDGAVTGHDDEVVESRWVPVEEALRLLTYENERAVARQAVEKLKKS